MIQILAAKLRQCCLPFTLATVFACLSTPSLVIADPVAIMYRPGKFIRRLLLLVTTILALLGQAAAQSTITTTQVSGQTPAGLASGSPQGTYHLSDWENINLFNGNVSVNIPLLSVKSRGSAGYRIQLPLEAQWMESVIAVPDQPQRSSSMGLNVKDRIRAPLYSPGLVYMRFGANGTTACYAAGMAFNYAAAGLTRLTFVGPDNSEVEMRDTLTDGEIKPVNQGCDVNGGVTAVGFNRERTFAAQDGSMLIFTADQDIHDPIDLGFTPTQQGVFGVLYFPNGNKYRIDNGAVSWIEDKNGNRTTFTYGGDPDRPELLLTNIADESSGTSIGISNRNSTRNTDILTYIGAAGQTRTITVEWTKSGQPGFFRTDQTQKSTAELFGCPGLERFPNDTAGYPLVSKVTFADSSSYQFKYDSFLQIAQVTLPTGGSIEYDHALDSRSGCISYQDALPTSIIIRTTERRAKTEAGALEQRTVYTVEQTPENEVEGSTAVRADHYDKDGTTIFKKDKHWFHGGVHVGAYLGATSYSPWKVGREYQTEYLDGSGNPSKREEFVWNQDGDVSPWAKSRNPFIQDAHVRLLPSNLVSTRVFHYDELHNLTDLWEYDFGNGVKGPLLRHTEHTYNYSYVPEGIYLLRLPATNKIYNAAGTQISSTQYDYDEYSKNPLQDATTAPGHNPTSLFFPGLR